MKTTYVSLFAGAGGFDVGFDAAGFRCLAQVEIDKTARSVLGRHWPDVPRFADVRNFGAEQVPTCDVVVGGFPCQDVSTAGRRKGFEGGERSSLWYEMLRVIRELRPVCVVWENVPGLLTADDGRAFAHVLVGLADLGFDGGWRTVDAQFFGVPQQRRRVFGCFARGDLGAERCAEILALPEGVRRRTPPRRKKGQRVAAPLTRGSSNGGVNPPGRRQEDDTNLVVATYSELGSGHATYQEAEVAGAQRAGGGGAVAANLAVFGGGECGGNAPRVAAALTAKAGTRQDFDTENFVLMQEVAVGCQAPDGYPKGREDGLAYTLTARPQRGHGASLSVCVTVPVTHSLTAEGADASEDGTGRGTPIVFNWQSGGDCRLNAGSLPDALSVGQTPAVHVGPVVRRLTPLECERLMGWPDDHTKFRADGSVIADGPRYRLCGNGVVGTVSRWLAERLGRFVFAERRAA